MTGITHLQRSVLASLGGGLLFIPHHLHSGSGSVLDTGDTQSAPTATQIPPTDLRPVCTLPAHQPKPPDRLTTEGQRNNPGGEGAGSLLTGKLGTILFTVYSATVLLLGQLNSENENTQHTVPFSIHYFKNFYYSPIRKELSLVHRRASCSP